MSTVLVIAPILVANWPMITAAITAATASMGFAAAREDRTLEAVALQRVAPRAEIEIENSEILRETAGIAQELVVERDGITARFTRDDRGALRVCVEGGGLSKSQLRALGEELIGRVTQQYVYNRVINEMHERNMAIVHEEVAEDRTVRIRVRNW